MVDHASERLTGLASTPTADPEQLLADNRRLRRELQRERARRIAVEKQGERGSFELVESVRELRAAQAELIEAADQSRLVTELSRALRQDLDSAQLVDRAAEGIGRVTGADRCEVLLVDAEPTPGMHGSWSRDAEAASLPGTESFIDLPEILTSLLIEAAQRREPLRIDDVEHDHRLTGAAAAEVVADLGVRSLAAVPIAVGDEVVGWMLMESVAPTPWRVRDLAVCESLSHDLVASLFQVRALEQQRDSVQQLRDLDRAKDEFISTVSHELRTPLTSIVGYLEMMAEGGMGELSEELGSGVRIIERNVVRLRALVEDLLTLSAYDARAPLVSDDPRLAPVDLAAVVERCHAELRPVLEERGVHLLSRLQADAPPVRGDADELAQVVHNLLANAVKFSHPGGEVRISLEAGGTEVLLAVEDHGVGIPAAEQDRLFARFSRTSRSVAEEVQGTGLGLALVRTITEWHGGRVDLTSVEGQGTTVVVRLPVPGAPRLGVPDVEDRPGTPAPAARVEPS